MKSALSVYIGMKLTGTLKREGVNLSFVYDTDYLTGQKPLPLSRHLPLQSAPFGDSASKAFFANLLPEGAIRIQVARQVGVSPENVFSLLEAIQHLAKILKNPPIPAFVRIGKRRAGYRTAKTDMIEFLTVGVKAGFNIPQTLSSWHLGISQTKELIKRGETFDPIFSTLPASTDIELMSRKVLK